MPPFTILSPTAENLGIPGGTRKYDYSRYVPLGFQDSLGNYTGWADAKLFGYLCEVWEIAWYGVGYQYSGSLYDVPRIGSIQGNPGQRIPFIGEYTNQELTAVVVEVFQYPIQSSLIFGEPPLINAGYCGFGWEEYPHHGEEVPFNPTNPGDPFEGPLQGGISITFPTPQFPFPRAGIQYINHSLGVFFPPARGCVDFWWHLQEGVHANIHRYGPKQLKGISMDVGNTFCYNPGDSGDCPSVRPDPIEGPVDDSCMTG